MGKVTQRKKNGQGYTEKEEWARLHRERRMGKVTQRKKNG